SGRRSRRDWLRGAFGSPCGGAFVEERAQAFLALEARAQLGRESRRLFAAGPFPDQPLCRPSCFRSSAEQLVDDAVDRPLEVCGDLVDEPDPKRGLGIEALT